MANRTYIALDLKSFYASVECLERGLNPMMTNLVVADESRTQKTICLAVSPTLKSFGISGRPRLFEVEQKIKEVNARRKQLAINQTLTASSYDYQELVQSPNLAVSYLIATPRMAHYIQYSTRIYEVYLKYVAPEDIHVYSIDEVFMDVTNYLNLYQMSARELARMMIHDVLKTTGITATAGIGPNMYLCKVAMDIVAKQMPADKWGACIAELDEFSYRKLLWNHRPLTSFWRVGKGYATKLEANGMYTMGDVARMSLSLQGENLLYRLFGVNAELLIDHAWGFESCTIADIKAYKPKNNCMSSGQILQQAYTADRARLVIREMTDSLVFEMIEKKLVTHQIGIVIGYDRESLANPKIASHYRGKVKTDAYGRQVPKHSRGTKKLDDPTSSIKQIMQAMMELYDQIVDKKLLVRRLTIVFHHLVDEQEVASRQAPLQLNLFTDYQAVEQKQKKEEVLLEKERKKQEALLSIRKKFGKNAILKGMSLGEWATAIERNNQIGGHKA